MRWQTFSFRTREAHVNVWGKVISSQRIIWHKSLIHNSRKCKWKIWSIKWENVLNTSLRAGRHKYSSNDTQYVFIKTHCDNINGKARLCVLIFVGRWESIKNSTKLLIDFAVFEEQTFHISISVILCVYFLMQKFDSTSIFFDSKKIAYSDNV